MSAPRLSNITFRLSTDVLRKAKIYATRHGMTINVQMLLEEKLAREGRVRAAAERFLAIAEAGIYFSTDPGSIRREELHDRK